MSSDQRAGERQTRGGYPSSRKNVSELTPPPSGPAPGVPLSQRLGSVAGDDGPLGEIVAMEVIEDAD